MNARAGDANAPARPVSQVRGSARAANSRVRHGAQLAVTGRRPRAPTLSLSRNGVVAVGIVHRLRAVGVAVVAVGVGALDVLARCDTCGRQRASRQSDEPQLALGGPECSPDQLHENSSFARSLVDMSS